MEATINKSNSTEQAEFLPAVPLEEVRQTIAGWETALRGHQMLIETHAGPGPEFHREQVAEAEEHLMVLRAILAKKQQCQQR